MTFLKRNCIEKKTKADNENRKSICVLKFYDVGYALFLKS